MIALWLWLACAATPAPPPGAGVTLVTAPVLREELTAARDRPRLYNFWATWCGPCVAELPRLAAFAAAHPDVEVVLVNTEFRTQRGAVTRFVDEHGLGGLRVPMIDDADPTIALLAIVGDWPDVLPVTMFVRADGTRGKRFVGAVTDADLDVGLASVR